MRAFRCLVRNSICFISLLVIGLFAVIPGSWSTECDPASPACSDKADILGADIKEIEKHFSSCYQNQPLPSERKKTLSELLESKSPNYRNYLVLFYPDRTNPKIGNTLKSCQDPTRDGNYVRRGEDGKILSSCLPENLYSWVSLDKIRRLETVMGASSWPKNGPILPNGYIDNGIYTVASPTGSFGYGDYSIRIHLKPDVKFVEKKTGCVDLSEEEAKNSVIVSVNTQTLTAYGASNGFSYAEYIVCRASVIESWSYGTPAHYDEIVKDIRFATNQGQKEDFLSYIRKHGKPSYIGTDVDGKDYTESGLQRRLREHLKLSLGNGGKTYVNPEVASSEQTKCNHFHSNWVIYFHDQ